MRDLTIAVIETVSRKAPEYLMGLRELKCLFRGHRFVRYETMPSGAVVFRCARCFLARFIF